MKIKSPKIIAGLFLVILGSVVLLSKSKQYVIILNNYGAGRLGDQIIGYSKAKWLSYKYGIPFRLIPFAHCENLQISCEQCYTSASYFFNRLFYKLFGRLIWVDTEDDLVATLATVTGPTRFVVHINTRLNEHVKCNMGTDRYDCSWVPSVIYELMVQYPHFGKALKKMLQPTVSMRRMSLPRDRVTVAVHIRKGGGFDPQLSAQQYYTEQQNITQYEQFININGRNLWEYISKNIPSFSYDRAHRSSADSIYLDKFPPEQYYVREIRNLSDFLGDIPLYVHIFTDDREPVQLTERIKKATDKPNIIFGCRTEKNGHDTNIFDDLYAMAEFDCLIRSGSCFGYIAQLLGNHKIIIYPLHLTWTDSKTLLVDRVGVIVHNKKTSNVYGSRA